MGQKSFADRLAGFVDRALEVAEELTIRVIDDLEKNKEARSFEPTPGYEPRLGDKVAIKPTFKVLTGHVTKIHSGDPVLVVVYSEDGEEIWTVNADTVQLIEKTPHLKKPESGDMETYYEERLRRAERDAQKLSQQHQDFVSQVREALGYSPAIATSFTEGDVLNLAKSKISTLNVILKRLGTQDSVAAIRAVEDLMGHSGGLVTE